MVEYVPSRGNLVWLEFDPQTGREIQKRRPALVISPQQYNQKVGLALFMPVTSHIKGYPFEYVLEESDLKGAILCDQVRSLDWRARKASFITCLSIQKMNEIIEKFMILLE